MVADAKQVLVAEAERDNGNERLSEGNAAQVPLTDASVVERNGGDCPVEAKTEEGLGVSPTEQGSEEARRLRHRIAQRNYKERLQLKQKRWIQDAEKANSQYKVAREELARKDAKIEEMRDVILLQREELKVLRRIKGLQAKLDKNVIPVGFPGCVLPTVQPAPGFRGSFDLGANFEWNAVAQLVQGLKPTLSPDVVNAFPNMESNFGINRFQAGQSLDILSRLHTLQDLQCSLRNGLKRCKSVDTDKTWLRGSVTSGSCASDLENETEKGIDFSNDGISLTSTENDDVTDKESGRNSNLDTDASPLSDTSINEESNSIEKGVSNNKKRGRSMIRSASKSKTETRKKCVSKKLKRN